MKARRAALTLIEAIISLVFITLLGIATATVLRGLILDSAQTTVKNRLEQSTTRVLSAIREEMRYASAGSIKLLDPDPANGPRVIEFQKVDVFDSVTGTVTLSPEVIRYEVNAQGDFIRRADGVGINIGGFAEPPNVADYSTGPGLSFERVTVGSSSEVYNITVRVRGRRGNDGVFESRSLQGRVNLVNP